jgi:hypothetical protein
MKQKNCAEVKDLNYEIGDLGNDLNRAQYG